MEIESPPDIPDGLFVWGKPRRLSGPCRDAKVEIAVARTGYIMAEAAGSFAHADNRGSDWTAFIDRWIYVFMAALFFVTALTGFVPDSLMKIDQVAASKRRLFR